MKKEKIVPVSTGTKVKIHSCDLSSMTDSIEKSVSNTDSTVKLPKGGDCTSVDENGNISDRALHDQIMEGVDERVNMEAARAIVGDSMTEADKDHFFPLK